MLLGWSCFQKPETYVICGNPLKFLTTNKKCWWYRYGGGYVNKLKKVYILTNDFNLFSDYAVLKYILKNFF